jgi:hypothetical protein
MLGKKVHRRVSKLSFSLLSLSLLVSVVAQFFIAESAKAACSYEGKTYQTGETVGPLICMPDGSMQPQ